MDKLNYRIIYIFPGQGSQYVGMGSDLHAEFAEARTIYDQASATLGFDVAELSFHDPENKLNRTRFTQLALLTHSIACLRVFEALNGDAVQPYVCAGHSLGEYSSLVAAGALSFENALRLVDKRGQLMSEHGRGKMVAFPMELDTVSSIVSSHYCGIGGCNLPAQTVIGGSEQDLEAVVAYVSENFKKRGTFLNTEGAFHTYLMTKAAEEFRPILESTEMVAPRVKVISNYSGKYHSDDPAQIKALLFFQLFNPVKWIWGMQRALRDHVHTVIEFGGGIGKGETPAEKRPNLAGITQRAISGMNQYGRYIPAINSGTLKYSTYLSRNIAGKRYYLFVPTRQEEVTESSAPLLKLIDRLDLAPAVTVICEPEERNMLRLQAVDASVDSARLCLVALDDDHEPVAGPFYEDLIENELTALKQSLEQAS